MSTTKQPSAASIRLSKAIRGYFGRTLMPEVPYGDDPVVMLTEDVFAPLIEVAEGMMRLYESKWSDEPEQLKQLRAALKKVRGK